MFQHHSSLIRQTFRKLDLALAVDESKDDELLIKDISDVKMSDWRLFTDQENVQDVKKPNTTDEGQEGQKNQKNQENLQAEDRKYILDDDNEAILKDDMKNNSNSDSEMND
jgi:hypothetical protein